MAGFVDPAIQAMNLIRQIGDDVSRSGEPIYRYYADNEFSAQFVDELVKHNIIKVKKVFTGR